MLRKSLQIPFHLTPQQNPLHKTMGNRKQMSSSLVLKMDKVTLISCLLMIKRMKDLQPLIHMQPICTQWMIFHRRRGRRGRRWEVLMCSGDSSGPCSCSLLVSVIIVLLVNSGYVCPWFLLLLFAKSKVQSSLAHISSKKGKYF